MSTDLCGDTAWLAPLDASLSPGRVVVIGEMHGTEQGPAFALATACRAIGSGRSVVVALELPIADSEAIAALTDDPSETHRAALVATPFWMREKQDGRSSSAMLELLDDLARMGSDHAVVVPIDNAASTSADRERGMFDAVSAAHTAMPERVVIVLVGNLHSQRGPKARAREDFTPMAEQLDHAVDDLVTLDMRYTGGAAWTCMSDGCGSHRIPPNTKNDSLYVDVSTSPDSLGYSGYYGVGELRSSPPVTAREDWDRPHDAPSSP